MKTWAKISCVVIMLFFFYYAAQKIWNLDFTEGIIFNIIVYISTYLALYFAIDTPLFYFAFSKNTKSKIFKIWAKISTILFLSLVVLRIANPMLDAETIITDLIDIAGIVPLYYFAWKKK